MDFLVPVFEVFKWRRPWERWPVQTDPLEHGLAQPVDRDTHIEGDRPWRTA